MKFILVFALSASAAFAAPVVCNPNNVGKTCYVGNGQKEITGKCVWLENHFLPTCLIVDCASKPYTTLNLNCKKSETETGICTWPRGFVVPQCE